MIHMPSWEADVKAGRAERLLFLVDREQLAEQAIAALQDLCPEYSSYWLKTSMARRRSKLPSASSRP